MPIGIGILSTFSNIFHKVDVRVTNNKNLAGGYKEANRNRTEKTITANGSGVNVFVAPWNGFVEELNIAGNNSADSVSSTGNHITVKVTNVTTSTDIASFDTLVNGQEILASKGFKVSFTPGLSEGAPVAEFKAGDVLSITVTVTGSPTNFTSSNICEINAAFSPADPHFAF